VPFLILVFFIFLGWVGYLAQINPGRIAFFITREKAFDLSITTLVLFSTAIGGGLVLLATGAREAKGFVSRWKEGRLHKKETRVAALYTDAVNASLSLRYRDATALFQKVLAIHPHHVSALLRLGKIHRAEKNYGEAIRLHKLARNVEEQNVEVLFALARDMEESERYEEAMVYLKNVIERDEGNLPAHARLRDLYVRLKRWEDAHAVQERIMKLALPKDCHAAEQTRLLGIKYEIGMTCMDQPDRAQRYFKEAVKADKMFLPPYVGLAELHLHQGKTELAARLLERGYAITRRITLLHRLEDLSIRVGTPERILTLYRRALARSPDDLILKFYFGKLCYRLEMIDEAYEVLSEVEFAVASFPDLHKILGNIHLRRGEMHEAVEAFKKSLKLKKHIRVPYYCAACDHHATVWSGQCARCGRWDSYHADPIFSVKTNPAVPAPY